MKKLISLLLISTLSITILGGCDNGGNPPVSGRVSHSESEASSTDFQESSVTVDESETVQSGEGDRIRIEISNENTEKGYLSAICPADWYDYSTDEKLFFSESETAGDYAKLYIQISYAPTATSVGGDGETISFELGSKNWEGLHNEEYNTYNVAHQLEGGGGLGVVSMGNGPDDTCYEMVVKSIWVEF